jgi:type I restriction enzyme R subunit
VAPFFFVFRSVDYTPRGSHLLFSTNFSLTSFDGEPVQIYSPDEDDPISPPDDVPPPVDEDDPIPPQPGDDEVVIVDPVPPIINEPPGGPKKYYIRGHEVWIVSERIEYLDQYGKLVTETLRDYSKKTLRKHYASLDDFLRQWKETERKQAIIEELENEGVLFEALAEEVNKDLDPFDLICHVAFDQPPLTRRERVQNIRKRDVFTKYGEQARLVLEALLQKYQDEGVTGLDDPHILKVDPFDKMGTPIELLKQFGGRDGFEKAVHEIQSALYQEVA